MWSYSIVCTAFPALSCLAAPFNPALAEACGKALGEEALYRRKDVLLGPGVNIYRTPLNGRNFEYMGEDPFLAASLAVPYIRGVKSRHRSLMTKHSLAPGASALVDFQIPVEKLAYFDEQKADWCTEPGTYVFWVGSSSASGDLNGPLEVEVIASTD